MRFQSVALGAISCLVTTSVADSLRHCITDDLCYSINIPDSTRTADASANGSSDIYLRLEGPTTKEWIALGQGREMQDAWMFIVYADAQEGNVTLSPRHGIRYKEPEVGGPEAILLDGSGMVGDNITANIRCSNCAKKPKWDLDLNSTRSDWLWAFKNGEPLKSADEAVTLQKHDAKGTFSFDLTQVPGGTSLNPFAADDKVVASKDGGDGYDSAAIPLHGTIMSLVFVVSFPLGVFLIRLCSFRGLVWVHAGVQLLALLGALIGLALGIYIGNKSSKLSRSHPIIGISVVVLLLAQPVLGYIHHLHFKRYQRLTIYTTAHIWYGRTLLTLGLINGFLGLRLSHQGKGTQAAYVVIAGLVWIAWMLVVLRKARRDQVAKRRTNDIRMAALQEETDGQFQGPPRRF
ncbi:MAG: hypothetical protein Q9163_006128 [Psora crenata]